MGHSSLLGIERAPVDADGRDTAALGPGDSSDSGSDMVGIDDLDIGDPSAPVDTALDDDAQHALVSGDTLRGGASDAAGTGERRSAGSDAGRREAADISVDRIFDPADSGGVGDIDDIDAANRIDDGVSDDEDPDLAFVDEAAAEDPLADELPDGESAIDLHRT